MRYKQAIDGICSHLGIIEYQILDPKVHELNRTFSYVVILGSLPPNIKINASKIFTANVPDQHLEVHEKKKIMATIKEAFDFVVNHQIRKEIKSQDVPRLADLKQFLDGFKGQVLEIKMPDGRYLGIYPDDDKLPRTYDLEYHASTVLNLARLQDIFGYTKLMFKEL